MRGEAEDFIALCEGHLGEIAGKRTLLVSSATHALEAAALLLDLRPGDEVIVPSFTHPSTVNAFLLRGATPIFVDVRADTMNIDERLVEQAIMSRTRAIVAMHYAGTPCQLDVLGRVATDYGVALIEDAAHALGGRFDARSLGSHGRFGCFSFHATKSFSCGEGGALVLGGDDADQHAAERLIHKGTDYLAFRRGEISRYTWQGLGSSYTPSQMSAAVLSAQLERLPEIQSKQRSLYVRYTSGLSAWCGARGFRMQQQIPNSMPSWHLFYLIAPAWSVRERLIGHLQAKGIAAAAHFHALNTTPMGVRAGGRQGACPVAEDLSDRLLRLPLYSRLTIEDQDRVIDAVLAFEGL